MQALTNKKTKTMSTQYKDHADFQSKYNSSKNFNTPAKDEALTPTDKGEVKLVADTPMSQVKKDKIADAMDKMRRGIEITPERVAQREEEYGVA